MSGPVLLRAKGISKRFKLYRNPNDRLLEWLSLGRRRRHEPFWALNPLDLELRGGECLGIIGPNGSGKSTLLKILSGALFPTMGTVEREGRCLALIELGAGFIPQLTGRQNIQYVGQMLGMAPEYLDQRTQDIIGFADLGPYIDQPTRSYSSGMFARLSFAMYAFLDPRILMIDEVLAVGDAPFKRKCFDLMERMVNDESRTTIYVSHGMQTVARLATRVLWLDQGTVRAVGDPVETISAYLEDFERKASVALGRAPEDDDDDRTVSTGEEPRQASESSRASIVPAGKLLYDRRDQEVDEGAKAVIEAVWLENDRKKLVEIGYEGTQVTLCYAVRFLEDVDDPGYRITLYDDQQKEIGRSDTVGAETRPCPKGRLQVVRSLVRRGLPIGRYEIRTECIDSESGVLASQSDPAVLTVIAFQGERPPLLGPLELAVPTDPKGTKAAPRA